MAEALTSGRLLMAIVAAWALLPSLAAHRLDEYLQATVAIIEPDGIRLRMRLTPGVDVADQRNRAGGRVGHTTGGARLAAGLESPQDQSRL